MIPWCGPSTTHFTRSKDGIDVVVVECLRTVLAIEKLNKRFRAGVYVLSSSSTFVPFAAFLPEPREVLRRLQDKSLREPEYPKYIQKAFGLTGSEQLNRFYDLDTSFDVQLETKTLMGQLFGYKFNNPICVSFDPQKLREVATHGRLSFWIATDKIEICVYGELIGIREASRSNRVTMND